MSNLKDFLANAKQSYYNGYPIISDEQYDRLLEQFNIEDIVGFKDGDVPHMYPMYSLQKYYEDQGAPPLTGELVETPKLDGAAVSILYLDGILTRVLTRGDGVYGKDVTDKFLDGGLVPYGIEHTGILQVVGEIVAPKTVANARNYASGALNLKNLEEFKTRDLEFVAYDCLPVNKDLSYSLSLLALEELGFNTVTSAGLATKYPTDGKVFRLNSNSQFLELGHTANHPRGAYALKTRATTYETALLDVQWQVGKTGKVTPVAILEPVDIDGAIISRATLNNPDFILSLGLSIGDRVLVRRAGEIIPEIVAKAA